MLPGLLAEVSTSKGGKAVKSASIFSHTESNKPSDKQETMATLYEVSATSETNKKTFPLKNGENILGRTHPDLGLKHNLKCVLHLPPNCPFLQREKQPLSHLHNITHRLSRQQVRVVVDVSARRTTIERVRAKDSPRDLIGKSDRF